ncbi:hypothetical protein [Methanosarcina horonobensis]|uniref:hypothetical protein n=1 Tax=Methanosarcina horonobensis TaxID=418008 RepID=UPI00138E39A8|nr:hypothetical protein [Methanosarcina horonobensis]
MIVKINCDSKPTVIVNPRLELYGGIYGRKERKRMAESKRRMQKLRKMDVLKV